VGCVEISGNCTNNCEDQEIGCCAFMTVIIGNLALVLGVKWDLLY
jgi:hypothetical protein